MSSNSSSSSAAGAANSSEASSPDSSAGVASPGGAAAEKLVTKELHREVRSVLPPFGPLFPGGDDQGPPAHIGQHKQLYCRVGFHLAIYRSGKVRGTEKSSSRFVVLEFSSVDFGEVRIKGVLAGLYLAMDCNGRLYGEPNAEDEGTVFVESYHSGWNTYLSRKYAHCGWYVAIRKNGKQLNGKKTNYARKNVHFLPRPVERMDVLNTPGDPRSDALRTTLPATCEEDSDEEPTCTPETI